MKILAMDTSTMTCSAALLDDGIVLAESVVRIRETQRERLMHLVQGVISQAGCTLREVELLAVGIGPGSFTGVRIAVATAKGLRAATGLALAGVTSLDALASAAVGARAAIATVIDARRGEVFAAAYRFDEAGVRTNAMAPAYGSPEEMGEAARAALGDGAAMLAIGDLDDEGWQRFGRAAGGVVRVPAIAGVPLARYIAVEAAAGRCVRDDDDALEPLYVRASDAKIPVR